jgi:hypothetical protein
MRGCQTCYPSYTAALSATADMWDEWLTSMAKTLTSQSSRRRIVISLRVSMLSKIPKGDTLRAPTRLMSERSARGRNFMTVSAKGQCARAEEVRKHRAVATLLIVVIPRCNIAC